MKFDWTGAKDYQITNHLLTLWNEERDAITEGTGRWAGVDPDDRQKALKGGASFLRRILSELIREIGDYIA